jgi:hypothetical protein
MLNNGVDSRTGILSILLTTESAWTRQVRTASVSEPDPATTTQIQV